MTTPLPDTNPSETVSDPNRALRRGVYWLLIAISIGVMSGSIFSIPCYKSRETKELKPPFFSANDRSRWCTIRSLVDYCTYEIDNVCEIDGWRTIDKVQHRGRDGKLHFYSSKPTLLPTMLAGEYWCIKKLTGNTLETQASYVTHVMLLISNVLPMLLFFVLLIDILERWGRTDWGRIFVMASATLGTFLLPFTVTLNNHLPAAVSAMIALWAWLRIEQGDRRWWWFALAGFFAAFTAANELPALAFFALLGAVLLWKAPWQTLLAGLPAAAVVVAAFFATNKIAHDSWRPPYMHRSEGDNWYDYKGSYWTEGEKKGVDLGEPDKGVYALHTTIGHHGVFSLTPIWLLSLFGFVEMFRGRPARYWRQLAALMLGLILLCWVFYVFFRPLEDRNYGGVSGGLRWLFWVIPMWLIALIPAADRIASYRLWRIVAVVLLFISVLSAVYVMQNPWSHPWLYDYWVFLKWIQV